MFIASVMPSSHLILWCPLLLLPSIFPSIRDFKMSCLFESDDQNTGASASASVLPVNIQGWSPLRSTGLISLLSKGLSGVLSSTTVWRHQFFGILPSLQSSSHNCMRQLERSQPWQYGPFVSTVTSLLFNILFRFVITFLLRSNCLLISWLQSLTTATLEPKKRKSVTFSTFFPSICHAVMGLGAIILVFVIFSLKLALSLASSYSSRGSLVPPYFLPLE